MPIAKSRKTDFEGPLIRSIVDYVNVGLGWCVWRQNAGAMKIGGRFIKFSLDGVPDIIGFTDTGHFVGIEAKGPTTGVARSQIAFHNSMSEAGCFCCIVRSMGDLEIALEQWHIKHGKSA